MRKQPALDAIVGTLLKAYGPPEAPPVSGPFELILWENVAYLVDDDRRERAFRTLRDRVGTTPEAILAADDDALMEVARLGGMRPEQRVERLREIARIAMEECGGDLDQVVTRSGTDALRILGKFPGIGLPGAEKILLLTGGVRQLALESNGLRVLLRLGFGEQRKSYAATYRCVREAAMADVEKDAAWLVRAHVALRRHGRTVCRVSAPHCEVCPLSGMCGYTRGSRRKHP